MFDPKNRNKSLTPHKPHTPKSPSGDIGAILSTKNFLPKPLKEISNPKILNKSLTPPKPHSPKSPLGDLGALLSKKQILPNPLRGMFDPENLNKSLTLPKPYTPKSPSGDIGAIQPYSKSTLPSPLFTLINYKSVICSNIYYNIIKIKYLYLQTHMQPNSLIVNQKAAAKKRSTVGTTCRKSPLQSLPTRQKRHETTPYKNRIA